MVVSDHDTCTSIICFIQTRQEFRGNIMLKDSPQPGNELVNAVTILLSWRCFLKAVFLSVFQYIAG